MIESCKLVSHRALIGALLVTFGGTLAVSADDDRDALRWKFVAGETFQVDFVQTANTETVGAGTPTTIAIVMGMEMTWRVEDVAADGTATMSQSFDRLTMSMKTGNVAAVDYDSATEPTTPESKQIAAKVGPLIGVPFQLTMTSRGEVKDVKLSEQAAKTLAETAPAGPTSLFSAAGVSRVLRQSVVVFPDQPLAVGGTWEAKNDVASPLGTLQQTSVYTFAGPGDHDGRQLEQITVASKLQVQAETDAARAKTKIKSQSQTGDLWFDQRAGRLVSSQIEQKMTTVRPYRDTMIEVRSISKLTTKIR